MYAGGSHCYFARLRISAQRQQLVVHFRFSQVCYSQPQCTLYIEMLIHHFNICAAAGMTLQIKVRGWCGCEAADFSIFVSLILQFQTSTNARPKQPPTNTPATKTRLASTPLGVFIAFAESV